MHILKSYGLEKYISCCHEVASMKLLNVAEVGKHATLMILKYAEHLKLCTQMKFYFWWIGDWAPLLRCLSKRFSISSSRRGVYLNRWYIARVKDCLQVFFSTAIDRKRCETLFWTNTWQRVWQCPRLPSEDEQLSREKPLPRSTKIKDHWFIWFFSTGNGNKVNWLLRWQQ